MKFNNEQLLILENLDVAYDEYIRTRRQRSEVASSLTWKAIAGKDYLYRVTPLSRTSKSLGPRSAKTEQYFAEYMERRQVLTERQARLEARMRALSPLYRASRMPLIAADAGKLLREADVRGLLGDALLVIGTNTMAAYELEAQHRFATGLDATQDCDLSWTADRRTTLALHQRFTSPLNELFKAVDQTYTINLERTFQFRNADAYEVEILAAPSRLEAYPAGEQLRPLSLPSQEWLTRGKYVDQVVVDRGGMAARIVAPDPRWMALHKLWLSAQSDRNPLKKAKDHAQGIALSRAILTDLPHYPVDEAFLSSVDSPLKPFIPNAWKNAAA